MKKIFMILFVICIFPIKCFADPDRLYDSVSVTDIVSNEYDKNGIVGNWYDSNGNLILKIGKDYTVNGCKIFELKTFDFEDIMNYKCTVLEKTGLREIKFCHFGYDCHEMLICDENFVAYKFPKKHFESVNGIYLGMTKDEVLKICGKPLAIKESGSEFIYKTFKVHFFSDVLAANIILYKNNDKFEEFCKKYNLLGDMYEPKYIGQGEFVFYVNDEIYLSLFSMW